MDQALSSSPARSQGRAPLPLGEFVALAAALMALTALGVDSMLPALPEMGRALGIESANHRQYVITVYLLGFAVAHLAYGPLADRYGRRPVLLLSLIGYIVTSAVGALAGSFTLLLIARAAMGMAAAGARVVTVAIIRDCFAGRGMARVMSLISIVFMAVPIIAPAFGQGVLFVASWRVIFWGMSAAGIGVLLWFWLRLPETQNPDDRQSLAPARILADFGLAMRDRCAVGYTIAIAMVSGGLFGFINSVQQIVYDVFGAGHLLIPIFAIIAGSMALGSLVNSRIVMRLGMRPISHWALTAMITVAAVHLIVTWSGNESLASFVALQALMMTSFGLVTGNFQAMAMERMGTIAGTASSLQGFFTTFTGAMLGALIGQSFDGSTVPLYAGFFLLGLAALAVVAITERGRMFRPS